MVWRWHDGIDQSLYVINFTNIWIRIDGNGICINVVFIYYDGKCNLELDGIFHCEQMTINVVTTKFK